MKTPINLQPLLTQLVVCLRSELQHYGEMLALLDLQQESVLSRAADNVLQSVVSIQEQMAQIQTVRQGREAAQAQLAAGFQRPPEASFETLVPDLPDQFRVTIQSLVRENNELLLRVQQRARQNHLLLSRSTEMMQQFINALLPAAPPKTYNPEGQLAPAEAPRHALYEAIG